MFFCATYFLSVYININIYIYIYKYPTYNPYIQNIQFSTKTPLLEALVKKHIYPDLRAISLRKYALCIGHICTYMPCAQGIYTYICPRRHIYALAGYIYALAVHIYDLAGHIFALAGHIFALASDRKKWDIYYIYGVSSGHIQRYSRLQVDFFSPSATKFPRAGPCPREFCSLGRKKFSLSGLYRCI